MSEYTLEIEIKEDRKFMQALDALEVDLNSVFDALEAANKTFNKLPAGTRAEIRALMRASIPHDSLIDAITTIPTAWDGQPEAEVAL